MAAKLSERQRGDEIVIIIDGSEVLDQTPLGDAVDRVLRISDWRGVIGQYRVKIR